MMEKEIYFKGLTPKMIKNDIFTDEKVNHKFLAEMVRIKQKSLKKQFESYKIDKGSDLSEFLFQKVGSFCQRFKFTYFLNGKEKIINEVITDYVGKKVFN